MKKLILSLFILTYTNVNADNKWVVPTKKICQKNGGKVSTFLYSKKYECEASYSNAINICSSMNSFILPTINDVKELIKACGGEIPEKKDSTIMGKNHNNKFYQSCINKKKLYTTYWLSNKKLIYFENGEIQNNYTNQGAVACVNPILSIPFSSSPSQIATNQNDSSSSSIKQKKSSNTGVSDSDVAAIGAAIVIGAGIYKLSEAIFGGDDSSSISSSSSSSSTLDFVMVEFDVTCSLLSSCIEQNLQVSGASGTGNFSSSYNGAYTGAIHKGYDGKLAGRYNWSAEIKIFDKIRSCSGSFYISGTKRNYTIRVYDDCRDAGSGEY